MFIPVSAVEYNEGGNTIWVHNAQGATVLRIKCTGKVTVNNECENTCTHSDMLVIGDIELCVPRNKKRSRKPKNKGNPKKIPDWKSLPNWGFFF